MKINIGVDPKLHFRVWDNTPSESGSKVDSFFYNNNNNNTIQMMLRFYPGIPDREVNGRNSRKLWHKIYAPRRLHRVHDNLKEAQIYQVPKH